MTQFSNFSSMQQDAQRRVYEMQQRASRALGIQPDDHHEQCAPKEQCVPKHPSEGSNALSCDSEKLLILLLLMLLSREQSSSNGLLLALLYLCI